MSAGEVAGMPQEVSGPNHEFAITGVLPGVFDLLVTVPGTSPGSETFYLAGIRPAEDGVEPGQVRVNSGQVKEIEVVLRDRWARVEGRVKAATAKSGGEIHEGAQFQVGLKGAGTENVRWMQADQNGRFVFERVAPGAYRIAAWHSHAGFSQNSERIWEQAGPAARPFRVEAESEIEVDLTAVP
jgi:hypothetical protein